MPESILVQLPTWFVCDNCGEKKFIVSGRYSSDKEVMFCRDCMEDLVEQERISNDEVEQFRVE
jgi:hypothetical protein